MRALIVLLLLFIIVNCGVEPELEIKGDTGPTGPAGADGANGLSITSNKIIGSNATDFCTQFADESCVFPGGQRVVYSDGTVFLLGAWRFLYTVAGDSDVDQNTVSMIFPSSASTIYITLSALVARGTGYKKAFLVYDKTLDTAKIYSDDNDNGVPDLATDTVLVTLTLSNF
jgi:hypothetical protein